jgi:hypothetical protein
MAFVGTVASHEVVWMNSTTLGLAQRWKAVFHEVFNMIELKYF